jgi:hypothetical protein
MPLSLFIPRVFLNISEKRIVAIFKHLDYGKVSRIDFVQKTGTNGKYKSAYIHFDYWYDNDVARRFQEKVIDPEREARIVYDDPWFWIVLKNNLTTDNLQQCEYEDEDEANLTQNTEYGDDEDDEDDDEEEDEEDLEMEQILDEMDETAALMGDESFALVGANYANALEISLYNNKNEIVRLQRRNDELMHALQVEIACLYYKENEVIDLETQLAHFKELLAQYEPDPRFQNRELVQY